MVEQKCPQIQKFQQIQQEYSLCPWNWLLLVTVITMVLYSSCAFVHFLQWCVELVKYFCLNSQELYVESNTSGKLSHGCLCSEDSIYTQRELACRGPQSLKFHATCLQYLIAQQPHFCLCFTLPALTCTHTPAWLYDNAAENHRHIHQARCH